MHAGFVTLENLVADYHGNHTFFKEVTAPQDFQDPVFSQLPYFQV